MFCFVFLVTVEQEDGFSHVRSVQEKLLSGKCGSINLRGTPGNADFGMFIGLVKFYAQNSKFTKTKNTLCWKCFQECWCIFLASLEQDVALMTYWNLILVLQCHAVPMVL